MENASKALIIAGSVLLSILVLSLIAYLYVYFGAQVNDYNETIRQNQLTKYNAQYTVYDGRKDLTVYDVVSIISTAYSYNVKHKEDTNYEGEYHVKVTLNGSNIDKANPDNSIDSTTLIINNKDKKFKCKVSFNNYGKVNLVEINQI